MTAEPDAVYFAAKDYAHVTRRFGTLVVDLAVLFLLSLALTTAAAYLVTPNSVRRKTDPVAQRELVKQHMKPIQRPLSLGCLAAAALYHVGLRRLRGGTLGYRLLGIRLVDHTGRPPGLRVLIRRFFLAVCFVLPLGASYLRCLKDPKRQASHDRWSGTWLVRRKAHPAGPARTAYESKLLGTLILNFVDVEPYVAQGSPESTTNGPPRDRADAPSQVA